MNRQITTSLVFAALILGVALGSRVLNDSGVMTIDPARINGVVIGMVLIWMGNMMPKRNPEKTCGNDPAAAFRMKRFAGMLMMLGGIGHAAIWLTLPVGQAEWASMVPVAATAAIVLATAFRTRVWV